MRTLNAPEQGSDLASEARVAVGEAQTHQHCPETDGQIAPIDPVDCAGSSRCIATRSTLASPASQPSWPCWTPALQMW